jgi:sugar lactone lactonase YvrE
MNMKNKVKCVWNPECLLGEGPIWSEKLQAILFVDIERQLILQWQSNGKTSTYPLQKKIGAIAFRNDGNLVAALKDEFAFIKLEPFSITPIRLSKKEPLGNRFNDGKCDPAGRFWAASMDSACLRPTGAIWRLSPDLQAVEMEDKYTVGNGFGWSPDGCTMYFTDSNNRTIYAYPFDNVSGTLGKKERFAIVANDEGFPDGLTVDSEGYVWSAHWDGWRITRYRPDGTIDRVISMPVPRPTSVIFGGKNYRKLYVTSARIGLSKGQILNAPSSGALFEIETDVSGIPEPFFAG